MLNVLARADVTARQWSIRSVVMVAAVVLLIVLARAVASPWPAGVTSDESLYLAEAVAIAGGRIEYASGDPIVHRPPLFPATLAPVLLASGNSLTAARLVPALYAAGVVVALFTLGRVLFGPTPAAVGALLAAVATYPSKLEVAFYVDTPATMWLFAAAAMLIRDRRNGGSVVGHAIGGVLLGIAFLTKETSALWLPLPLVLALAVPVGAQRMNALTLLAWGAGFAVIASPWLVWVWVHSGGMFKIDAALAAAAIVGACALLGFAWCALSLPGRRLPSIARGVLGLSVIVGWVTAGVIILEMRPEPHTSDYLYSVPDWTFSVLAPNLDPFWLILLAWGWLLVRAVRGDEPARIMALIAVFLVPVFVYVANRGWEPRQVLPLVYLSYLVLGAATVALVRHLGHAWGAQAQQALLIASVVLVALVAGFARPVLYEHDSGEPTFTEVLDWNSQSMHDIAAWLDSHVSDGSTVLASRLYHTQLFFESDGRFRIRQLPTVGVTVHEDGLRPFGTLFRYEDDRIDVTAERRWLYVQQYPGREYAIALAEEDLVRAIQQHRPSHVLIVGNDAGFSSTSYVGYFLNDRTFTLLESLTGHAVDAYLFRVEREQVES
jgi:4-amino-4-deoxy-L-arabinose transferase-like glycosyltransferase